MLWIMGGKEAEKKEGRTENSWEIIKILVYDITFRLMVEFI